MRISQLLLDKRPDVVSVAPSESVGTAVALMQREHVGAVLVLDPEQHVLGVLSERDVVHHLADAPLNVLQKPVFDIARRDGPVAVLEDSVQAVMERMTQSRARHVPVLRFGRVVGIVSIGDVVKSLLEEKTRENTVLQDIARAQFFAS
ncbi:MAG TPA: CBS domain-containing protein [Steroidobacteraceae bacterium]|nr:CBS domain-containing protein [Steroidobacteraceae bacterium]